MLYTGGVSLGESKQYQDYKKWLIQAKPNDRFIYYTGNSLTESIIGGTIGKVILDDAYMGFVYLVQKRNCPYVYDYIAIKASANPPLNLIPTRAQNKREL